MAKNLKPKCLSLLDSLKERAIQQVELALQLFTEKGKTYSFNAPDAYGKRIEYDGCIGCFCEVYRRDEHGRLVYYSDYGWMEIQMHDNASELAKAADMLLEQATAKPEREEDIIPEF